MKKLSILIVLWLACLVSAFAATAPTATPPPLLPAQFAGWQQTGEPQVSRDPSKADAAFVPLLKEYGFTDFESATYTRPGRKLLIKAARFADASGAYGAFTFYKQPEMLTEKIGDQGASSNLRILFYRGNVLVDAVLDRLTAMSAAELRELAGSLPLPAGSARNIPTLPTYLPKQAYVRNSARYVVGPVGLSDVSAPISADLVDFNLGAEIALGRYSTSQGTATLMIISYPTPQIAGDRLRTIEAATTPTGNITQPTTPSAVQVKRTGPLVALVSGQISPGDAKSLLASVNYDADVTWNENTFFSKRNNVANLLVNVILLVGILLGFMIIVGFVFGGARVFVRRWFPGTILDRSRDSEIISLRLGDR